MKKPTGCVVEAPLVAPTPWVVAAVGMMAADGVGTKARIEQPCSSRARMVCVRNTRQLHHGCSEGSKTTVSLADDGFKTCTPGQEPAALSTTPSMAVRLLERNTTVVVPAVAVAMAVDVAGTHLRSPLSQRLLRRLQSQLLPLLPLPLPPPLSGPLH